MPLVFEAVFSTTVISRIESIAVGQVGGGEVGVGGSWGAVGRVKQTQMAVLCHQ